MWYRISKMILRLRIPLVLLILGITIVMGYFAKNTGIDHTLNKAVPFDHEKYVDYRNFKETFGEDGDLLILTINDDRLFQLEFFLAVANLSKQVEGVEGITEVISLSQAYRLQKDKENQRFSFDQFPDTIPTDQRSLNALRVAWSQLPFYENVLYYPEKNFTILAVRFDRVLLDSEARNGVVTEIMKLAEAFETSYETDIGVSGLPFIRSYKIITMQRELKLVLLYAVIILAIILLVLFRSFTVLAFPFIVVSIGIVWGLGIIGMLGYKLTVLTSLVPNLIVIISVPNCIYLVNKYHSEFKKHGNKTRALSRIIEKIGYTTFFANLTTAIGFGAFIFTRTKVLEEFGIVASITITCVFFISIICVPIVFSFLPEPKTRHVNYLDYKLLSRILDVFQHISLNRKYSTFTIFSLVAIVAVYGMTKITTKGFILDDVPKTENAYLDLKFIEKQMGGIMPLEILIDTKKKNGVMQLSTLKRIDKLQSELESNPSGWFHRPVSVVNALKYGTQAYFNGNPKRYRLPKSGLTNELTFVTRYLRNMEQGATNIADNFVDSNAQIARVSVQIPDIGSHNLTALEDTLYSITSSIFPADEYDISFTGTSLLALEGFRYLVKGLLSSLGIAFLLIAFIMAYLFRSFRMLVFSLIPNIIPLCITAGIMGYFSIPLKPSTVLVYSVAFGISVDFTIHFLAKYKQELSRHNWDIRKTVEVTMRETGMSMIFTSLILFFGFGTFIFSSFDGTIYLGLLVSLTLTASLFSNMLLLPALLNTFDQIERKRKAKRQKASS